MVRAVNRGALAAQKMLKISQRFKYSDLKIFLDNIKEPYEFEYIIPGTHFVYDLMLFDRYLLIEFDGMSHNNISSYHTDRDKDLVAEENGLVVEHVKVDDNLVIPAETILGLMQQYKPV